MNKEELNRLNEIMDKVATDLYLDFYNLKLKPEEGLLCIMYLMARTFKHFKINRQGVEEGIKHILTIYDGFSEEQKENEND